MPGVPRHTLALGASAQLGAGWRLYGGVEAASDAWVDYANTVRRGAHALWHAGLRWRSPDARWQAQLLARNLFDREVLYPQADFRGPTEATRGDPRFITLALSRRF